MTHTESLSFQIDRRAGRRVRLDTAPPTELREPMRSPHRTAALFRFLAIRSDDPISGPASLIFSPPRKTIRRARPLAASADRQYLAADPLAATGPAVLKTTRDIIWWRRRMTRRMLFRSAFHDLEHWEHRGFVISEGQEPQVDCKGRKVADFGPPRWRGRGRISALLYRAQHSNALASGLQGARARRAGSTSVSRCDRQAQHNPIAQRPAQRRGDRSHIFIDAKRRSLSVLEDDSNGICARPLAVCCVSGRMIERLFESEVDRRTAAFASAVVGWANGRRPMERFFLMQPFIAAVLSNWPRVKQALTEYGLAEAIVEAMTTPVWGQRLADDGQSLIEAEGVRQTMDGRASIEGRCPPTKDRSVGSIRQRFRQPGYGIGVAVADHPLGPYSNKRTLLRSTRVDGTGSCLGRNRARWRAAVVFPRLPSRHRRLQCVSRAADRAAPLYLRGGRGRLALCYCGAFHHASERNSAVPVMHDFQRVALAACAGVALAGCAASAHAEPSFVPVYNQFSRSFRARERHQFIAYATNDGSICDALSRDLVSWRRLAIPRIPEAP